jgi:hypothetical protein
VRTTSPPNPATNRPPSPPQVRHPQQSLPPQDVRLNPHYGPATPVDEDVYGRPPATGFTANVAQQNDQQGAEDSTQQQQPLYMNPSLHRYSSAPPVNSPRSTTVPPPDLTFTPPPGPTAEMQPHGGKSSIKAPKFSGTDIERVKHWFWKTEAFLRTTRVPPNDWFATTMFALEGDAEDFVFNLIEKKHGHLLEWREFREAMYERYDRTAIRADLLRQQLERVHYDRPSKMVEYCTAFRKIEQQILAMDFDDKLRMFLKPLPFEASMHVRLINLEQKEMDTVYQAARQWAHVLEDTKTMRPKHHHHYGRRNGSVLRFRNRKPGGGGHSQPWTTETTEAAGEELDAMYAMEQKTGRCYGCGKEGHYLRDCLEKQGRGGYRGGFGGGRGGSRYSGGGSWRGGRRPHFKGMEMISEEMLANIEVMAERGYELAEVEFPATTPDFIDRTCQLRMLNSWPYHNLTPIRFAHFPFPNKHVLRFTCGHPPIGFTLPSAQIPSPLL